MSEYEDEFLEADENGGGKYARDAYFLEAQRQIRELYEHDRQAVYYIRQLQVKFEKQFLHWITNNALVALCENMGYLRDERIERETGTSTRYFIHRSNRYAKRRMNQIERIVEAYSNDNITRSCGHRAEDLFCKALAFRGFQPKDEKVRGYRGKSWTQTGHDLDFVFERDGIAYGCEIKNSLGYIDKAELEIKLDMCSVLGLKPLFIMRYAPKTYINMVYRRGGFVLIFETQIYELSQGELVKTIQDELGLPVICSKAIPDGIIDRFEKWHKARKHVN